MTCQQIMIHCFCCDLDPALVFRTLTKLAKDTLINKNTLVEKTYHSRYTLTSQGIQIARELKLIISSIQALADKEIIEEELSVFYRVLDSESVSVGERALIALALQLVNNGMPAHEIVKILEEEKKKIHLIALLDTLEYLKKGGRISKTANLSGRSTQTLFQSQQSEELSVPMPVPEPLLSLSFQIMNQLSDIFSYTVV